MAEIVETIAGLLWIVLAVVAWRRMNRINAALKKVVKDMEEIDEDAIEALMQENAKLKAERDAALQFVKKNCYTCKHEPCPPMKPPCFGCKQNFSDGHSEFVNWEWRGVQEVNDVV